MTAVVRFLGPIRRPWTEASRAVDVGAGATVADLLATLGFARHELAFLQVARNGVVASLATPLCEGDEVDVMLRVGGG